MTLYFRIIIILSCNVIIFNLPPSHGDNQGYHTSQISQILTPSERLEYSLTGSLPNRIYYSPSKGCYVVRGQKGHHKNDLQKKDGKQYKAIPRWKYYVDKLSPVSMVNTGIGYISAAKPFLGLGGGVDSDHASDTDDSENGGSDDDKKGENDTDDGEAGDENNETYPGMFSNAMGMLSPLFNLFGGSNNEDNNNDNEKEDKKKNDDEDQEAQDSYTKMATDALQSDTAKEIALDAISMFVPGGPAIVKVLEAGSKLNAADEAVKDLPGKLPKF